MIAVIPHDLVGAARTLGASSLRAARLVILLTAGTVVGRAGDLPFSSRRSVWLLPAARQIRRSRSRLRR